MTNEARNTERRNPQRGAGGPKRLVTRDRRAKALKHRIAGLSERVHRLALELLAYQLESADLREVEGEIAAGKLCVGVLHEQPSGRTCVSILGVAPDAGRLVGAELLYEYSVTN